MSALAGLEPKEVFHYFEEISNIPRPSYKEEKISNYLVNFAKERNLEYYQDEVKNVIIIKEAAPGYEDVAPLMIQDIWTWCVRKNRAAPSILKMTD